mgnify:CR=1 FL=1
MNWMKYRPIYFAISGVAVAISIYAIVAWGFKLSIDFTGGTIVEYQFPNEKREIRYGADFTQAQAQLEADAMPEKPKIIRFETVGPTFSKEILQKTYTALAIATVGILLWVAWQFKSFQFGVCAVLATLHDTIIVLGTFSALGHFRAVEVDVLFVTAVLTVLSFSVHDTIVVYDRIRETMKKHSGLSVKETANKALSETMVRSLNNSLTIVFMLVALFLMGGASIKWFVFALLVGTISGTYSSPFVAVPLLVTWDEMKRKLKR